MYWVAKDKMTDSAKKLIDLRNGIIINNYNADNFFSELAEKIEALEMINRPHPLSLKIAMANAKKYLSEDKYTINLHDLILREANKVAENIRDNNFPVKGVSFSDKDFNNRVQRYESACEILLGLFISLCYWGKEIYEKIWIKTIEIVANSKDENQGGLTVYLNLKRYPALLIFYAGGIAALANNKYDIFVSLLIKPRILNNGQDSPAILNLNTCYIMEESVAAKLHGRAQNHYTPFSDYLQNTLLKPFEELLIQGIEFQTYFDRFEYLCSLIFADMTYDPQKRFWVPTGSFGWRGLHYHTDRHISKIIDKEINELGKDWPLLREGLFNGSIERLKEVKIKFDEFYLSHRWAF